MVISPEDIRVAKEKIGDRNADLIAEILHIEQYNSARKVGCCPNPSHHDEHPSCSYNPKGYNFHCFSCGYNVDLIDALMFDGKTTFVDACAKLFEEADMPFSLSEQGILRDNGYRYPKPNYANNKDSVYEYWKKRCISPETIDYLGIEQDTNGNTLFQYYNTDDTLIMVKVRPSRRVKHGETKIWFLPNSDSQHILYNMNKINPTEPLIITSGEGDCASAIEAGCKNAVSISHGEKSFDFISDCWEFLEQFSTIILVGDHDETGAKFVKEVSRRLGESRVKVATWNDVFEKPDGSKVFLKDLNELLYYCGTVGVREAINNAVEAQIETVVDFATVKEADMEDVTGFSTGLNCLDKALTKFYDGTLNIISGSASAGKSSLISTLVCRNVDQDRPVFLFSAEMSNSLESNWLRTALAGQRGLNEYDGGLKKFYRVKANVNDAISENIKGKIFLYKDDKSNMYTDVLNTAESVIRRNGVKTVIIDNMSVLDFGVNGDDKWDEQNRFVQNLVGFAKKFNVCLILVIHPKKLDHRRLGLYDLAGVTASTNLCHRCLSLYRIQDRDRETKSNGEYTQEQFGNYDVCIDILKDRFGAATGYSAGVYYDCVSRRFYDSLENLDYDYLHMFDKSTPLPYGSKLQEEQEVYGKPL